MELTRVALRAQQYRCTQGASDIVVQYLTWAFEILDTETLTRSLRHVAKTKSVDETDPSISLPGANIMNRLSVRENSFLIGQKELASRES